MDHRNIARHYNFNKALIKTNKASNNSITGQQAIILHTLNLLRGYSTIMQLNSQLKAVKREINNEVLYIQLSTLINLQFVDLLLFGRYNRYTITAQGKEYLNSLETYLRKERHDK